MEQRGVFRRCVSLSPAPGVSINGTTVSFVSAGVAKYANGCWTPAAANPNNAPVGENVKAFRRVRNFLQSFLTNLPTKQRKFF